MVKAASLLYAIFISLIISILCYSIVLLFSLQLHLNDYFSLKKKLLLSNQSAQAIAINNNNEEEKIVIDGINVIIQKKDWGIFKQTTIKSNIKNDSITQEFFIATKRNNNAPTLYVRDNDETFKISGKTKISGDIYISGKGIEKINIAGINSGKPNFDGNIFQSNKEFPKAPPYTFQYPDKAIYQNINDLQETQVINPFLKKTIVLAVENRLSNITLKGNIIIHTKDTLFINSSAKLEDVIIDAPKVIFEKGFIGAVQIFSTHGAILKEDVVLKYPSVIIVKNNVREKKEVIFNKKTKFFGLILLHGNGLSTEGLNSLVINNQALILGDIYCDGRVSLYGTVYGSIYASAFFHKTSTTHYTNLIFDGELNSINIPKDFFSTSILDKYKKEQFVIVKKI